MTREFLACLAHTHDGRLVIGSNPGRMGGGHYTQIRHGIGKYTYKVFTQRHAVVVIVWHERLRHKVDDLGCEKIDRDYRHEVRGCGSGAWYFRSRHLELRACRKRIYENERVVQTR